MSEFIVYCRRDEVLVFPLEKEDKYLDEYFNDTGRDLQDYDREVIRGCVQIETRGFTVS